MASSVSFHRILVVCVGNICRSPTAEVLLRQLLPRHDIRSAGLAAVSQADMDPRARAVAEARGLVCPPHQACQLTPALCVQADLILVMETRHRDAVSQLCPSARGKTFLLGQGQPVAEIADPFRQDASAFEHTYDQLHAACLAWAQRLT